MMLKKKFFAGAAATSLAGAGGGASAQVVGPAPDASGTVPDLGGAASYAKAAEALGMSEADLLAQIAAGESIGSVAAAEGVDPRTVIDALTAAAKAEVEALQAAGLDSEIADLLARGMSDRIAEFVGREGYGVVVTDGNPMSGTAGELGG